MATHPTVIVGVGQAGIRVMSKIEEVVQENNDEELFKYIAIDSDDDMLNATPDGAKEILLKLDDDFTETDREYYPYLTENMKLQGSGAQRQRPVGRYKLDSRGDEGYTEVLDTVRGEIEAHHQAHQISLDQDSTSFNIVHIHSLGGGTGSGTYPLLMTMLSQIQDGLSSQKDVIYLAGVGVAPQITFPPEVQTPPGDPDYYPNAYAAYNDLNTFTSLNGENNTFLPTYARTFDRGAFHVSDYKEETNSYDLPHVPFDDYWLVGVEEDKIEGGTLGSPGHESYKERVNQTTARAVHGISKLRDSAENWASDESYTGTFAQAEISVPHQQVEEFVDLKENRQTKQDEKDEIPTKIAQKEDEIEEFKQLKRNLKSGQVSDAELENEIDTLLEQDGYRSGKYILDNKEPADIVDVLGRVRDDRDDDRQEIDAVILAADKIEEKLNEEDVAPRLEEAWRETIQDLWKKYEMNTKGEFGGGSVHTDEGKATTLQEYFEERIDHFNDITEAWEEEEAPPDSILQRVRDVLPPVVGSFTSEREHAEAAIDQLKEDRQSLKRAIDNWSEVEEMIGAVAEERTSLRNDIDEKIRKRNERITELQEKEETLEDELQELDIKIEKLGDTLTEEKISTRIAVMPIIEEKLAELDRNIVDQKLTSLKEYVDNDFIDEEQFEQALNDRVRLCKSWEKDIVDRNFERSDEVDEDDTDFPEGNEFWYLYHEDNEKFKSRIERSPGASEVEPDPENQGSLRYLSDPYRIEYISYTRRGPVESFETYQDYQVLKDEGTLQSLAKQYDDYRQAFAYLEWYGKDIREAFDTRKPVTLPQPPELTTDHINKPDLSEEEITDKITSNNWLDSYLWQGFSNNRYDAAAEYDKDSDVTPFSGWKETDLDDQEIGWYDFKGSTPSADEKDEWLDGWKEWEDLLEEYADTLTEELDTLKVEVDTEDQ